MRPQENIVKLIVNKHVDVLEVSRLATGIGVNIDILDQLDLLDLAMDIIGFPKHNILEFDIDIIFNNISTQPDKRKDFENMFDRDKYKEGEWDLSKGGIDNFVEKLYSDFDELILSRPHFFVKK
ncbi:MAG TPA: hypothetical protein VK498_05680 [Ferruginibacter sp.]|nr:hypothetical protein [Ferruginibacter sp.]